MNRSATPSMKRSATLSMNRSAILSTNRSVRPNMTPSMSSNVTPSTNRFVKLSTSNSAALSRTLSMRMFVKLSTNRNATRSTTRSVRVLSLPMEDLVTAEALVALVEVETVEAAVVEPSLATVLHRLPPAVKFLVRNAELSQDRSVPTYQGSSATMFLASSAAMSRDRWRDKNVPTFLANSARLCQDSSAPMCPVKLVRISRDNNAEMFLVRTVSRSQ